MRPDKQLGRGRIVFNVCLLILVAMIVRKAWRDLDMNWDSLAYHLPLAALRTGIMSQQDFRLSASTVAIFGAFPVIPDYLQGWAWRLTSRIQAANLIGLFSLLAFAAAAKVWFRISFAQVVVCLLAIPVVLIGCSSAYVDLWVNSVMATMLLLLFRALIKPETFGLRNLFIALAAFALALNSKIQFPPVGTLALAGLAAILWINRHRLLDLTAQWKATSNLERFGLCLLGFVFISAGYLNTLKNWLLFRNPFYPAAVSIGPIHWPGIFENVGHQPSYLSHVFQPLKWLLSIFEYDAFDVRRPLWAVDAGYLPVTSHALRMGGYFGAYVALNLVWFAFLQRAEFRRYGWRPLMFVAFTTALTAALPLSQELRYYSFWMLILVVVNLVLIHEGDEHQKTNLTFLFVGGAVACLSFVTLANGAAYVRAAGVTPKRLVAELGIKEKLLGMKLRQGETVCVARKSPFSFMYAPMFNSAVANSTHYRVIEADDESECGGVRIVP